MAQAYLPVDERATPSLWRNVSFLLMWSSVAASGFGDRIMMLAAMTLLGATADDVEGTSVLAAVTFFFFLPYLFMSIPGGWLADRLPRKWLMLGCDEARAVILLWSFVLVPAVGIAVIPDAHHWKIYAVMAGVGTFAALFSPVRNAVVPQIVPLKQLQSANALLIGIAVIASLVGLLVGGEMIDPLDAGSVRTGLLVGALFFAVSGTFFAFLKIRPRTAVMPAHRGKGPAAWPYLLRHRKLLVLIVISMVMWGVAFVVYNAALALARHRYGFTQEDEIFKAFARMGAALGAGMLAGAVGVAWMNTRRESGGIGMVALLLAAVCTFALAWSRSYYFALLMAFGVGFFGNTAIICITTLLQSLSPNYIRGRVMGVNSLASTATNVAVNFIIWQLPNSDTLVIGMLQGLGLLLIVIAVAGLWMETTRTPTPSKTLNVVWRVCRTYALVWHRVRWIGRHRIPHQGAVILASNHTTALDPVLIQSGCCRVVRWVMLSEHRYRLMGFLWRKLQPVFLDRDQRDTTQVRRIVSILKDEQVLGFFPEGGLQREHRQLRPFQPGLALIARRSGAPIVPVWIEGTPRKQGMLWHFLLPSRSTVVFGESYRPDPNWRADEMLADLRRRMLDLAATVRDVQQADGLSRTPA